MLTLLTPANNAATAAAVVSSASAWTPAVSSCATVAAPCTIAAVGPSSSKCTAVPTTVLAALGVVMPKPPISKVLLSLPETPSALLMFSISTRLWVPLVVHCTLSPLVRPVTVKVPSALTVAIGVCDSPLTTKLTTEADVMLTCVSLVSPSTKFTPGSAAVVKAEILTVTGPMPGLVWLTVKDADDRIDDVLEVDVGFDIGLVLVQVGHEEVRVRARDVGDERTLIGVDLRCR